MSSSSQNETNLSLRSTKEDEQQEIVQEKFCMWPFYIQEFKSCFFFDRHTGLNLLICDNYLEKEVGW